MNSMNSTISECSNPTTNNPISPITSNSNPANESRATWTCAHCGHVNDAEIHKHCIKCAKHPMAFKLKAAVVVAEDEGL